MLSLMKRVFNEDSAELKRLYKHVTNINELEAKVSQLSDEELKEATQYFKEKIASGVSIQNLKEEAFAIVREASNRVLGMRHYDVQILGGLVLLDGGIAQMATGEGKTLVATLPTYLKALEGKGVHVITANEYLAKRDCEQMGKVLTFLGLNVGLNISQISESEKKDAYNADITYGTGTEFGFDYLRDNMVNRLEDQVQRPLHYAIVDEIDSILIDEARTPLIIASKSDIATELFQITSEIVRDFEDSNHYEFYPETKQIVLADNGANVFEEAFGIANLYDAEHRELLHNIMQSLRAHVVMRKDVDYIVKNDQIMLVDQYTGRIMEGRTFSDGLHQAIEAKEGVTIKEENQTQASITVQNYFRMYTTLAGMTGSAMPAKQEFWETYNLRVVAIPTNKPNARQDEDPLVYKDYDSKVQKIVDEVSKHNQLGRPVLIGTTSIEQSERLSSFLTKANIKHQILNAKTEEDEALIIAQAGQRNKVMISTNMAGRGTDILLGEGVRELGGLQIIGTELHESARIDMQLRGRAGRQGDPGSTQFIISIEDDIFHSYDKEEMDRWKKKIKSDENGLIVSPNPVKFVKKVQETVEGAHFSSRNHLLKLDDIVDEQRKIIYKKRNDLLTITNFNELLKASLNNHLQKLVEKYCPDDVLFEDWPTESLYEELTVVFGNLPFPASDLKGAEKHAIQVKVDDLFKNHLELLNTLEENENFQVQIKNMYLQTLDHSWIVHMELLFHMREDIGIRGYGQEDPYRLYAGEAYEEFLHFLAELDAQITKQAKLYIQHYLAE
ncbi:accessory Sec system translocase SecA2 [Bacillus sp. S/N-304-OC-R1]|uniref:accessory Sec system translocase SecA2 n=1 Tax=Bacillus sp. S/N-304-OC-R1 TaxID=2758034 RepID=UPI001C8E51DB|nr:accessory Sec system translocase SecA2 [Bacillus sp. S/N-304-OC-R1]MBY0123503.1 accessory Sec system translocase SecA2 [Bacillus sp. S/N-304-OC-R1]